ncbi:hypothetical protein SOL52_06800 [Lactobacillus helveticus]|uniref:hypothetical protein n=1 Tax=Lactobacillus helveticus TaxID=1587 RepID=UPI00030C610C|nr:hypothetical protein [Lactobacillus helveticus]MDY0875740.1 hypothetical protein [Lactobacillus helveticus]NRO49025.1 hypothetical protein [Lactobacillus helveticus]NRO58990.1 hypothetical protein [Lactobacillus helveticus]URN37548.1 hypothetical protein M9804_03090 [Lactobacillus helveticus]
MKRKLILFLTACSIIFSVALIKIREKQAQHHGVLKAYTQHPSKRVGLGIIKRMAKLKS